MKKTPVLVNRDLGRSAPDVAWAGGHRARLASTIPPYHSGGPARVGMRLEEASTLVCSHKAAPTKAQENGVASPNRAFVSGLRPSAGARCHVRLAPSPLCAVHTSDAGALPRPLKARSKDNGEPCKPKANRKPVTHDCQQVARIPAAQQTSRVVGAHR